MYFDRNTMHDLDGPVTPERLHFDGWGNRETWSVYVNLFNNEALYNLACRVCESVNECDHWPEAMGEALKALYLRLVRAGRLPLHPEAEAVDADDVDWEELAGHFGSHILSGMPADMGDIEGEDDA